MAMQKGVNPSVVFQQRRWRFPKMGAPKSPSVSILKCSFMTWRIWGYPYFGKSPNSSKPIAFYAKMFAPVCIRNEGWCVSSDVWIWTRTSQNCMTTIGGHSWVKAGICCFFLSAWPASNLWNQYICFQHKTGIWMVKFCVSHAHVWKILDTNSRFHLYVNWMVVSSIYFLWKTILEWWSPVTNVFVGGWKYHGDSLSGVAWGICLHAFNASCGWCQKPLLAPLHVGCPCHDAVLNLQTALAMQLPSMK